MSRILSHGVLEKWTSDLKNNTATRNKRGQWITLTSSHAPRDSSYGQSRLPMYAIGWRDIQLVALISNVGTSHRSLTNAVRYRSKIIEPGHSVPYTQQYQFELERPEMVARFVSHWHEIDVNDHFRQGLFAIERLWPTQNWAVRLFSTILAVIVVNAYLAYLFDMSTIENNDPVNFVTQR